MLTITRGRTFSFDATIFDTYVGEGDPGNVPTNHTGWTIRSQIRTRVGNKLVANLNVTFPVPTAGTVAIRHEREFTRSLATGDYWWDIVATDPAGDDHVYVEPEPIAVRDNPTDPANATYDFVPGGGGAVMHTHVIADVTGLQAALNGKAPVTHTHSIADVTGLQAALNGKAPLAHTHVIADVLNLQTELNNKAPQVHTHVSADITDATSLATPSMIVRRDADGGASFRYPDFFSGLQEVKIGGVGPGFNEYDFLSGRINGNAWSIGFFDITNDRFYTLPDEDGEITLVGHGHSATDIGDSSTTGRAVLTAPSQSAARTAIGAGTTGASIFTSTSPAAANTVLANNIVTKAADFTIATADAGTYMRLTKTGSTQVITLPISGIAAGAEFQFYRVTTQSLSFAGSATVNGGANLASVPTNGAFALKHIASGTYDFI